MWLMSKTLVLLQFVIIGLQFEVGVHALTCKAPEVDFPDNLDPGAVQNPDAVSDPGLYFYSSPFDSAPCNGTVTGFEFCYRLSTGGPSDQNIFLLLVLREIGNQNYTVTVSREPDEYRGDCDDGNNVCCSDVMLGPTEQFAADSSIHYVLLIPPTNIANAPLLYSSTTSPGYTDLSLTEISANHDVGSMLTADQLSTAGQSFTNIPDRMFRFTISYDDPVQSPSPSIDASPGPSADASVDTSSTTVSPTQRPGVPGGDSGGGGGGGAVAAAVVVPLLVLIAIAAVASVLVGLYIWRRRTKDAKYSPSNQQNLHLGGLDNAVYLSPSGSRGGTMENCTVYLPQEGGAGGAVVFPDKDGEAAPSYYNVSLDATPYYNHSTSTTANDEPLYMEPASQEDDLYAQFRRISIKSISRQTVRHPEANQRPTFPTLVQWLFRPDSKLLKWSEEKEDSEDAEAGILGAELKAGINLYTKLQNQYVDM